jgi:sugar phosphate isomerase/epimerase
MFRIGTTSYIIPADILPNVEYLAPLVDDVQLVLFEADEYGSNLPDAVLRSRLVELAATYGITYTVHLPLDLCLAADGDIADLSLLKAQRVIEATRDLSPFAYTAHLDGRELMEGNSTNLERWQANARRALEVVCGWLDDPRLLCVENVERWDPEAYAPVLEKLPVSRTIDIGHLWLQGIDPLARLPAWIDRARVVHLHGIDGRDHASLAHVPRELLVPIVTFLHRHFTGAVTIEVFNQEDLISSLAALQAALGRPDGEEQKWPKNWS